MCDARYEPMNQKLDRLEEIPITTSEKAILGGYAALAGVDGISLLSTGLWYMTTPAASAGLGVTLTGATAALTITGVGLAVLLIALPIACFTYKNWLTEAENLQNAIQTEHLERKRRHEILFFELLKLRCQYKSGLAFQEAMKQIKVENDAEIEHDRLIKLINETYKKCHDKHYSLEWSADDKLIKLEDTDTIDLSFSQLIEQTNFSTQASVRQAMLRQLEKEHFQEQFSQCFKKIAPSPKTDRSKAIAAGVIAGLTTAVITLGTEWTFSALLIGAGLAASLPGVGWALLGVGCLVLGAIAGVGIYQAKQKNLQRGSLKNEIQHRNTLLTSKTEQVSNINVQKARELYGILPARVKQSPQNNEKMLQAKRAINS
jgi:hypothetical protein